MPPSLRRGLRLLAAAGVGVVLVCALWLVGGTLPSEPARWLWWGAFLGLGLGSLVALGLGLVLVVIGLLSWGERSSRA